jgi:glycosidase
MRALVSVILLCGCAGEATSIDDLRGRPHRSNADVDWRDQVIYQIMVDRFENGDPNNDFNIEPNSPARYHGGDWRGVKDRLDYIEELGVTAIWISPVVRNVEEDAGFASYHGYWTQDFVRPNPHFGDLAALRDLVDAAHERGILVILDVVTNHVGQLFYYDMNGNGRPDDWLQGGGNSHTCLQICNNPARADECTPDELVYCEQGATYFERITEWDPEYDPRGIQAWTSLGFAGPAPIEFLDMPEINRTVPQRPPAWFDWPADAAWFDDPSWYNRHGRVYLWWHESDYSREFVRQQETLGDFPGGLKDLDTDHPDVREALVRAFEMWIEIGDFDGFRIDTLKHIDRPEIDPDERGFWGIFTDRMRAKAASLGKRNFFLFGEAFDGNDALIGAYTFPGRDADGDFGRLDAVFYFSQKYRVIDEVFKDGGPTRNIQCLFDARFGNAQTDTWCADHGFPAGPTYHDAPHATPEEGGIGLAPQQVPVGFLDNHDLERFLHRESSFEVLANALFYLMTWDGIPCVYYGTEQAFNGGNDPFNREDMRFETDGPAYGLVREFVAFRRAHVALRRGEVAVRWATDRPRGAIDSGIFAFERVHADETLLVVINTAGDQDSRTCAPVLEGGDCMATAFAPGTTLTDIAPGSDGASFTVTADGTLDVTVPARGGRILAETP